MLRNVYPWMARPRLRGYKRDHRRLGGYGTEFDRWMVDMDINRREAAMMLDIPESRVRDLQAGWRNGRLNGGIIPSFITRHAMAALKAGLDPVPQDPECWDMIVRLGEAAALAGVAPWPPGEKLKVNPFGTQKGAFAVKEKRPRYQRKERKEKVAVAVEPPVKKPHPSKGVPLKRVLTPKPPRKKPVTDADGWESGGL